MSDTDLRTALTAITSVLSPDQTAALDPVIEPSNTQGLLAVAPQTPSEIAAIFDLCNATKTPLIPHGGRTSLAGAVSAQGTEIMLLGTKMPPILDVDPVSQTVHVSANTTLADLESAARKHGLTAGIDLAARDTATTGGMISTNAGGMEAHRNGTMRERVLGLEAVLPNGTILSDLAHVRKCNEGYDVKQLLVGGEGTLGVITSATLQLLPEPPDPSTFLLALPDAAAALSVLRTLHADSTIQVLRAEAMWNAFATKNAKLQTANPLQTLPNVPLYVIYEVHVSNGPADESVFAALEPHFENGAILDAIAAQSAQQANDIWMLREDTMSMGAAFPHSEWFDISVPLAQLDSFVKTVEKRIAALDSALMIHVLGHLGDGNLHYSIAHTDPIPDALKAQIKPAVLDGLKDIGGSFSAEHGIGTEKRDALQKYGDAGKMQLNRMIKQMIDPNSICNPGKVL
jgi:FAD/FMN-containing dehydrogenase